MLLTILSTLLISSSDVILTTFKTSVDDPQRTLRTWNSSLPLCESWSGISCSDQGKVVGLHISSLSIPSSALEHVINGLDGLANLRISKSNIGGSMSLTTCSLKTVEVTENTLVGKFPAELISKCTGLKVFNVSHNQFNQSFELVDVGVNDNLEVLDLSGNHIRGSVPSSWFTACKSLRYMDLSVNQLAGQVPEEILSCKALELVSLAYNNFSTFPGLTSSNKIQKLSLASNSLSSLVIRSDSACAHLTEVDVSSNKLSGPVFYQMSEGCSSLQRLNISDNGISGTFFLGNSLDDLPALEVFDASFNNLTGELFRIHGNVRVLNLSSNAFTGTEKNICSDTTSFKLEKLVMPNNRLAGPVQYAVMECHNLKMLDLSFNTLYGEIPAALCESLPRLEHFLAWVNNLQGIIPPTLSHCANLTNLVLSYNSLQGSIPPHLSRLKNLSWLCLSSNRLTGTIPRSFGSLTSIRVLQLSNNSLQGEIPAELAECPSLAFLDLAANSLNGSAQVLGRLGPKRTIMVEAAPTVDDRGIRFTQLTQVPKCRGMDNLYGVQGIKIREFERLIVSITKCKTGVNVIADTVNPVNSMALMSASYNQLEGEVPVRVGGFSNLRMLDLAHNLLTGVIPELEGARSSLQFLDLSQNRLHGEIPASFSQLTSLIGINVSYNNLSGTIPQNGQLITFDKSSFEGNPLLCGIPLNNCNKEQRTSSTRLEEHGDGDGDKFSDVLITFFPFFFVTFVASSSMILFRRDFPGLKLYRRYIF